MIGKLYLWMHRKLSRADEKGEYSAGVWQHAVREQVVLFLADSKGKFLEVGCGEGLLLLNLANKRPDLEISGIDLWEAILDKARKRLADADMNKVKLAQADASDLPFEDISFDSIACINVLFNLPSEEKVLATLKEAARILKPGGKLIIDIRNSKNPLLFLKYKFAKYYDKTVKDLPLRTYHYEKISGYLDSIGLKIKRTKRIGFPGNTLAPIIVIEAEKG